MQPAPQKPETDTPPSFSNREDRVVPANDTDETPKSKFGKTSSQLLTPEQLAAQLGIDPLDAQKIGIKRGWKEDGVIKMELESGQKISHSRDSDGVAHIHPPKDVPNDAVAMVAMAKLAVAKGWKSVRVETGSEEYRALSCLAINHAGIPMDDPPPPEVVDKYRERFNIAMKTGIDPVAEEKRQELAALKAEKPSGLAALEAKEPKDEPKNKPVTLARKPAVPAMGR